MSQWGIYPIRIPIPLIIDHVNVYLIDGPAPVLVDTGFFGDACYSALSRGLSAHGKAVTDIGTVLITHGHRDHSGLARIVRERSGARVFLHRGDVPIMASNSFNDYFTRVLDYYREMGVDRGRIDLARSLSAPERGRYRAEIERDDSAVTDGLCAGDRFETGAGPLTVIETPGHTTGSVSFLLEDGGILISGDLISVAYDPLPLVLADRGGNGWLNTYDDHLASLEQLCRLDPALVLPGHGGPISRGRRLAQRIITAQEHLTARIEQIIVSDGDQTIASLTDMVYPNALGPILTNALNVVRGITVRLARQRKVQIDGGRVVRLET